MLRFTLLLFIFIFGCSKESTVPRHVEISFSKALVGENTGGVILIIRNDVTGKKETRELMAPPYVVNIPDGKWSFQLVSFQGPGAWMGTAQCGGRLNLDLGANDLEIHISTKVSECLKSDFKNLIDAKGSNQIIFTDASGKKITKTAFVEGDIIHVQVNAFNPYGKPLEYKFVNMRNNSEVGTFRNWTSSNKAQYTVGPDDIGMGGLSIIAGIRDNDGIDADGSFGDQQMGISFSASDGRLPATISSVNVTDLMGGTIDLNNLALNQTVRITINAIDPLNLPLEYKFTNSRQNMNVGVFQDWSTSNTATYTVSSDDIGVGGLSFVVGVKNNDGVDFDGFFGDAQSAVSFLALNGKLPAIINSVMVTDEIGSSIDLNNLTLNQVVRITVNATDPNSLPLEYKITHSRQYSFAGTVQEWATSNTALYTITSEDMGIGGLSFVVGARNNDGVDYDGFFGDAQSSIQFSAPSASLFPYILQFLFQDDLGNVITTEPLTIGQVLRVTIMASDPLGLPLEFMFVNYRNNMPVAIVQNWSTLNSFDYTVTADDIGASGLKIQVNVRNNDGHEVLGLNLGDFQASRNFTTQ